MRSYVIIVYILIATAMQIFTLLHMDNYAMVNKSTVTKSDDITNKAE